MLNDQENLQREVSLADLKDVDSRGGKIFIYGNGGAGRWLWKTLDQLGVPVHAFVDTDVKKLTFNFGFHTMNIQDVEQHIGVDDLLLIGAVDIHEILTIKNQTKLTNVPWASLGAVAEHLEEGEKISPADPFDKYAVDVVKECHKRLLDPNDIFLRSVDIMITEKCTLKCRDCANLMQYYERPKDGSVANVLASVDWLLNEIDGVHEFRLIGGEPFMNKQIYQIIEHLLAFEKYKKLVIYTNGMIPLKADYRDLLLNEKIVFSVTDYGDLARNTSGFVKQLEDWGCVYRVHPPEHWTDSGRIAKQHRRDDQNQKLFDECCGKNLWTLSDKGFGRCPFAVNAAHLGAFDFADDSVVEVGDADKLKKYIVDQNFLTACDLCNGRSFSADEITPAIQTRTPLTMEL